MKLEKFLLIIYSSVNLHLNSSDYVLSNTPQLGTLNTQGHVSTYHPNLGSTGVETLTFASSNGGEITYNIEVLSKNTNSSFVQDDQYFVITNGSIAFDVF